MIHDTLANAARYEALSPRFAAAFAWLRGVDGTQAPCRHDIDGDHCFALVQTYATKPEAVKYEAHRKYIDVQFIHSGRETILWAPLAVMGEAVTPYDDSKDAVFFAPVADHTALHLGPGHFTIFYPRDAHAPCLQWGGPEQVFKVVIKVAVG